MINRKSFRVYIGFCEEQLHFLRTIITSNSIQLLMARIIVFRDYETAEKELESTLERNREGIGALESISLAEQEEAVFDNPPAELGKELTLCIELYRFVDAYTLDGGILRLAETLDIKPYPSLEELAHGTRELLHHHFFPEWQQAGAIIIQPFFYTLEQYESPSKDMNEAEREELREKAKLFPPNLARELLPFLEELFEQKPVVRGLTAEEQEAFIRAYDALQQQESN